MSRIFLPYLTGQIHGSVHGRQTGKHTGNASLVVSYPDSIMDPALTFSSYENSSLRRKFLGFKRKVNLISKISNKPADINCQMFRNTVQALRNHNKEIALFKMNECKIKPVFGRSYSMANGSQEWYFEHYYNQM